MKIDLTIIKDLTVEELFSVYNDIHNSKKTMNDIDAMAPDLATQKIKVNAYRAALVLLGQVEPKEVKRKVKTKAFKDHPFNSFKLCQ